MLFAQRILATDFVLRLGKFVFFFMLGFNLAGICFAELENHVEDPIPHGVFVFNFSS